MHCGLSFAGSAWRWGRREAPWSRRLQIPSAAGSGRNLTLHLHHWLESNRSAQIRLATMNWQQCAYFCLPLPLKEPQLPSSKEKLNKDTKLLLLYVNRDSLFLQKNYQTLPLMSNAPVKQNTGCDSLQIDSKAKLGKLTDSLPVLNVFYWDCNMHCWVSTAKYDHQSSSNAWVLSGTLKNVSNWTTGYILWFSLKKGIYSDYICNCGHQIVFMHHYICYWFTGWQVNIRGYWQSYHHLLSSQ